MALGLAALGLFARRRDPLTWTLAGVSLLAVLLAFGYPTPQFKLAYHYLPGVALFRAPSRILVITSFTLPVLATLGGMALRGRQAVIAVASMVLVAAGGALALVLQRTGQGWLTTKWYPSPPIGRQLLVWALVCLAAAVVVLGAQRLKWRPVPVLVALGCADLLLAAQPSNVAHPVDPVIYSRHESTTSLLPSSESPYRSLSVARTTDAVTPVRLADPGQQDLLARDVIEHPNLSTRDGLASIDGYEGGILPLGPYIDFRRLLLPPGFQNQPDLPFTYVTSEPYNRPLLQLLGVRYLLVSAPQGVQQARLLGYRQVASVDGLTVFEDDQALPRAHLVGQAVAVGDDEQALRLLADPSFDPRHTATLSRISCAATGAPLAEARLLRNDAETVEARAQTAQTSLLVVTNVDYPGWTATVDGRPAPLGRVDGLLQGLCLPPGDHDVVLTFRPTRWPLAVAATSAGAVALLALVTLPALRRRRPAGQTERASQRSRG